jgi:hypothetical protein
MKTVFSFGLAAFVAFAAHGALAAPTQRYSIELKVEDNGVVIGEPRLIVAAGEPARIEIGQPDGARHAMGFTLNPTEQGTIKFSSTLTIRRNSTETRAAPVLIVKPGTLSVIEIDSSAPTGKPSRIEFRVNAA